MAKYLTVNARFNPFSYDELVKPLEQATTAHRELEDAYSGLSLKADVWKNKLKPTDTEALSMYNRFSTDLEDITNILSSQGLTPSSRQDLLKMHRRYASEITPIEEAYAKREADIKRQQTIQDASRGRTVFSRDASTTSLNEYMKNGASDFAQVNLDDVYKEALAGSKSASSRYQDTKEGYAFGKDYNDLIRTSGLSPEEALTVLTSTDKYKEFRDLKEDILGKYIGNSQYSSSDLARINSALEKGIYEGIVYDETHQPFANWRTKATYEQAQLESQYAPIELLDTEGNPSGYYVDPKTGYTVTLEEDDKGNKVKRIATKLPDNVTIPTSSKGKGATVSDNKKIPGTSIVTTDDGKIDFTKRTDKFGNPISERLKGVASTKEMEELGFEPAFVVARHKDKWQSGVKGEDIPGVWSNWIPGVNTRTNLATDSGVEGNFTYTSRNKEAEVRYVENITDLPREAFLEIARKAKEIGITENEDFKVLKVQARGSRSNEYDYIIYRYKIKS